MKSNCCKAMIKTNQSDEGTGFYSCEKCGNACDLSVDDNHIGPVSIQTRNRVQSIVGEMSCIDMDIINHPTHYTDGGMETIDIIKAKSSPEEFVGFLKGNVIKYVTRAGKKVNKIEDLRKAQWYLNKLVESVCG